MRDKLRVSMGTLKVLGLELLSTDADTTTAYLQTYHPAKCRANCLFCAQARGSSADLTYIARGVYPPRDTESVVSRIGVAYEHGLLERACIQTMNYPDLLDDLMFLVDRLGNKSDIPVSVSVFPVGVDNLRRLKNAGVDRIVVPLDAATPKLFDRIKGASSGSPYSWDTHRIFLDKAVEVFGSGKVGTHLIIGLGESVDEALGLIDELAGEGIYTALFAYTPIEKTQLGGGPPDIRVYRIIQLASYLIEQGISSFDKMSYSGEPDYGVSDRLLDEIVSSGAPFRTRGCPGCNRPYSTEKPGGVCYNYPRRLGKRDLDLVLEQLGLR
ncbi:MAG: radical SAM protein [Candidatus Altiarchaeales archaeon ex4484_96]|nr:MAG: radical SAM protein [Candidatus Altiarchaeales archaeon ex4484_96]